MTIHAHTALDEKRQALAKLGSALIQHVCRPETMYLEHVRQPSSPALRLVSGLFAHLEIEASRRHGQTALIGLRCGQGWWSGSGVRS
jgi:hypothetical protein